MSKEAYSNKLKNPLWQRKRLEILQRDNFRCKCCLNNENTLHVHHVIEDYSIEPWEHDSHELITLCEDCHSLWHKVFSIDVDSEKIISIVRLYQHIEYANLQREIDLGNNKNKDNGRG